MQINPSNVHLQSRYLTLRPCISSFSSTQSCSFFFSLYLSPLRLNCFIASLFLLMPFPHSLPMYLSQTSLAIYLYLLLNLSFTIRIAIILLLFFHISLSHSLSVSLAQPLTILHFIFATLFLSFLHSYYVMTIINIDLFCFNNNYFFARLVACLYEDEYS